MSAPPGFAALQRQQQKTVVIVEDSNVIRMWLRHLFDRDPRLHVVAEAADAREAERMIKAHRPDVVTLDISMPGMDGLAFLERLMRHCPTPVVMISGSVAPTSPATVQAFYHGAIDCIQKPDARDGDRTGRDIVRRVFAAACCATEVVRKKGADQRNHAATVPRDLPLIVIGASTGGVTAVEAVLHDLDPVGPPVVVVQHMPGAFLVGFADQLDRKCAQDVGLVHEDHVLGPGQVRIAPAMGAHTGLKRVQGHWRAVFQAPDPGTLHCPSVEHLFGSVANYADQIVAVMLTGLGRDGAAAMRVLRDNGAITIGQDEQTSAVYGMPRAAWEMGAVTKQVPLNRIGSAVNAAAKQRKRARS